MFRALVLCALCLSIQAKFYPKEFDLSLLPEARNCEINAKSEGICAGGNWAHVFAQGLYLSHCVKDMKPLSPLSSEHLLQCVPTFNQDRCTQSVTTPDLIDLISQFIENTGVTSHECLPYESGLTAHLLNPKCPENCKNGEQLQTLRGKLRKVSTIEEVKDQIGQKGPAIIAISYKTSLNQYNEGEYKAFLDDEDQEDEVMFGIRFVLITGWKTNQEGKTIWKAQNTFGSQWGNFGIIELPHDHEYIITHYVIDV